MNNLILKNDDFGTCRTIVTDENEALFCLKDICNILGLQVRDVRRRLDGDVISTHPLLTKGGEQNLLFINENGLYDTILESRKPLAKAFRKWVTREVLPSIAKTGNYITNGEGAVDEGISMLSLEAKDRKIKELVDKLEKEKQRNRGYKLLDAYGNKGINVSEIAVLFGYSAPRFNLLLQALGIQHKIGKSWIINSKYDNKGYTTFYSLDVTHSDGTIERIINQQWTQCGMKFLVEFLEKNNINIRK